MIKLDSLLKLYFLIPGRNLLLPCLPTIPGDEGVGQVVETGFKVGKFKTGDRVVLTSRMLGTWRYYGIYDEKDLHLISHNLPLPEASMLTITPCIAYRLLHDFKNLNAGETVVQNAANSPIGQCVIQLCKTMGLKSLNIVSSHCGYESVKRYLYSLGATAVHTLEEAEELTCFNTSLDRPALALNCLGGRHEDVLIRLVERDGVIVYYGCAFDLPMVKLCYRCDVTAYKFHYGNWSLQADDLSKTIMLNRLMELMVIDKLKAPMYIPVELKNFLIALRDTVRWDAFATHNYVFDFTLP